MYRFPGFCEGKYLLQGGFPYAISKYRACYLKRNKAPTFTLPFERKLCATFPSPVSMRPHTRHASLWRCISWGLQTVPSIQKIPSAKQRIILSPGLLYALWPAQLWTELTFTAALKPPWDPRSPPALLSFHQLPIPFFHSVPPMWIMCIRFVIWEYSIFAVSPLG